MAAVQLFIIISCIFEVVIGYRFQKPLHNTLITDSCSKNEYRLNDCNWCYCEHSRYKCKARVCNEVDVFGHFTDAIQDINVGMEGHGVWRSKTTVCDPGVQYDKGDIICVCAANGTWPNPICRDAFRTLHTIEINEMSKVENPVLASNSNCEPSKLYLIGCNVCFCPNSGLIDPELCTKTECSEDDPAVQLKQDVETSPDGLEVYADCNITLSYEIGCMKCVCLRNNRLVCESCPEGADNKLTELSLCSDKKPNEVFNMDCNQCSCDDKGLLYCTTKKCLKNDEKQSIEIVKTTENNLRSSNRPIVDMNCEPETSFTKDCNRCFCNLLENGKKTVGCTMKPCIESNDVLGSMKKDCVVDTVYQSRCLKCRCDLVDGEKRETCLTNSECSSPKVVKKVKTIKLDSLNGYCEPQHTYAWDCNTCRCLSDGGTVVCTSKICERNSEEPVIVDIIPVRQPVGPPCPKDHVFQIECNRCYCLDNGNALCTTNKC